eukprot:6547371-Lingulodinium_polyedra.AAC.1
MERATRAICEALPPRAVDSTASLCTVFETVRNDAKRPSAAAAAHKSDASRAPFLAPFLCSHGVREACDLRGAAAADGRFDRIIVHGFRNRAQ